MYRNAIDLDFQAWNVRQYALAPLGAEAISGISARDHFAELSSVYDNAYRAVTLGGSVPENALLDGIFQENSYLKDPSVALMANVAKFGDEYRYVSPVLSSTMFAGNSTFHGDYFGLYADWAVVGSVKTLRSQPGTYVFGRGSQVDTASGIQFVAGMNNVIANDGDMAYIGSNINSTARKLRLTLGSVESCDYIKDNALYKHYVGESALGVYSNMRCIVYANGQSYNGFLSADAVLLPIALSGEYDIYVKNTSAYSGGLVIGNDIESVPDNIKFRYGNSLSIYSDGTLSHSTGYTASRSSVYYRSRYVDGAKGLVYSLSSNGLLVESQGAYMSIGNGRSYSSYAAGGNSGLEYIQGGLKLFNRDGVMAVTGNSISFVARNVNLGLSAMTWAKARLSYSNMSVESAQDFKFNATSTLSSPTINLDADQARFSAYNGTVESMSLDVSDDLHMSGIVDFAKIKVSGVPSTVSFQKNPITGRNLSPSGEAGICTGFYTLPEHNIPIGAIPEAESALAINSGMGIVWKRSDGALIYLMKDFGSRRIYAAKMSESVQSVRALADGVDFAFSVGNSDAITMGQGRGEILLMRSMVDNVHKLDSATHIATALYDNTTLDYLPEAWYTSDSGGVAAGTADVYDGYTMDRNNSRVVGDMLYIDVQLSKNASTPRGIAAGEAFTGIAFSLDLGASTARRFMKFIKAKSSSYTYAACVFSKWDGSGRVSVHISSADAFMQWSDGSVATKSAMGDFVSLAKTITIQKAVKIK